MWKFKIIAIYSLMAFSAALGQTPVVDFVANVTSGCGSLVVEFSCLSTNSPSHWKWELGNGTTIQGNDKQNIVFVYATPGVYTVTLTATNANGNGVATKANYITVFGVPQAQFSSVPSSGCAPLHVQFSNQSAIGPTPSAPITSWLWDFGNGNSSTLQSPSHNYTSVGSFNVTLEVKDGNNCINKIVKNGFITTTNKPGPSFYYNVASACAPPLTVTFTNTTSGNNTYFWSFGDGNTSTQVNPTHTYTSLGVFSVMLIAINASGCKDTLRMPDLIKIGIPPINININPTSVCAGAHSIFSTSIPATSTATWDLGNGFILNGSTVSFAYTNSGTYNVKLTIQTLEGCVKDTTQIITVYPKPTVNFSADTIISCNAPFTVNFLHAVSPVSASSFSWDFGDFSSSSLPNPSKTYTSTGSYSVSLSIIDDNGCFASETKYQYVNIQRPTAYFVETYACNSGYVIFNDSSHSNIQNWEWHCGDGNTISGVQNPSYTYASIFNYTVKLIVTDNAGCKDSIQMTLNFPTQPLAAFTYSGPDTVCYRTNITLENNSLNADTLIWVVNGASFNNNSNLIYNVSSLGYIFVSLTAYNNGCSHTTTLDSVLFVLPPKAEAFATPAISCTSPFTVQFNDASVGAQTWSWNFGDGNASTSQHPSNTYLNNGFYTAKLVVTYDSSIYRCTDSSYVEIKIGNVQANFLQDKLVICQNDTIKFWHMSTSNTNITNVDWNFGDGTLISNFSLGYHIYNSPGIYDVSIIATDALGCKDTLVKPAFITVRQLPDADFLADLTSGCTPEAITFSDLTTYYPPATSAGYLWDFGDAGAGSMFSSPQHFYHTPGLYSISLLVVDSEGCADTVKKINYIDLSITLPDFSTAQSTPVVFTHCYHDTVKFINTSIGASQYFWEFGDGNTSSLPEPAHFYNLAQDSVFDVTLITKGTNGCESKIVKQLYISRPISMFSADNLSATCPPLITGFQNLSSSEIITYYWDFGDTASGIFNNTSTLESPVHTYSNAGAYSVMLAVENALGCRDTSFKSNFIVVNGPLADFDFFPKVGCPFLNVTFTVFDTSNVDAVMWVYGDGTVGSGPAAANTYDEGVFIPALRVTDVAGCSITKVGGSITVYPSPKAAIAVSDTAGCSVFCTNFSDISTVSPGNFINSWIWIFSDGDTISSQNPSKCFSNDSYSQASRYSARLIVASDKGCKDEAAAPDIVAVYPKPFAEFDYFPKEFNVFAPQATFVNSSLAQTASFWNFGFSSDTINLYSPFCQFPDSGYYKVSLIVENKYGCLDTAFNTLYVEGGYRIFIPNAFTPNNDGLNEFFKPVGHGIAHIKISIFNRWGQIVYFESGPSAKWDGKINGIEAPQGIYPYIIEITNILNPELELKYIGEVAVVR
jgi:gliding motility-associated-like protein